MSHDKMVTASSAGQNDTQDISLSSGKAPWLEACMVAHMRKRIRRDLQLQLGSPPVSPLGVVPNSVASSHPAQCRVSFLILEIN